MNFFQMCRAHPLFKDAMLRMISDGLLSNTDVFRLDTEETEVLGLEAESKGKAKTEIGKKLYVVDVTGELLFGFTCQQMARDTVLHLSAPQEKSQRVGFSLSRVPLYVALGAVEGSNTLSGTKFVVVRETTQVGSANVVVYPLGDTNLYELYKAFLRQLDALTHLRGD